MRTLSTSVIVVGAGPVGMCLAIEAARRGVDVVVIEPRSAGEPPSAKCNTVAARTLETFRRFGVADQVRAAGLPDAYPTDVMYASSVAGPEFTRIELPSRDERTNGGYIDSQWLTPEPMVRVSQIYLEPLLFATMAALSNVTIINGARVDSYEQFSDQVIALCTTLGSGESFEVVGRYLVGCDGGRSNTARGGPIHRRAPTRRGGCRQPAHGRRTPGRRAPLATTR